MCIDKRHGIGYLINPANRASPTSLLLKVMFQAIKMLFSARQGLTPGPLTSASRLLKLQARDVVGTPYYRYKVIEPTRIDAQQCDRVCCCAMQPESCSSHFCGWLAAVSTFL
jgi:hypothetical protein